MLAGRMEMELRQPIHLAVGPERPVDGHLDRGPQVLELGAERVGVDDELDRAAGDLAHAGVDVDGRLVLSGGAQRVGGGVEAVPVQGPVERRVAECADGDGALRARVEVRSVVACCQRGGDEGEGGEGEVGEARHGWCRVNGGDDWRRCK